ncbi:MAG: hypothetical protein EZS26_001735 [Candidatus Ordinivivax streblomastigis]|uniref:Uncharacterized protein n=1 Tax=Candidatus Ordinivivax streblomastigis TaxID=2540710 RepID=A0A5M8P147_9BACT|nr:MAG: hypothetical protein EZS26_001735 [Candidatus Ordinivivax streblomastigis]
MNHPWPVKLKIENMKPACKSCTKEDEQDAGSM